MSVYTRIPRLDGLRCAAAMVVFLSHAVPATYQLRQPWGHFAVLFFFVLSGFVITKSMIHSWDGLEGSSIRIRSWIGRFFFRRAVRILPPLVVVLFALRTWIPGALEPNESHYWLFMANLTIYWHQSISPGSSHLWSIAVEEQFYVIWPVVMLLGFRMVPKRHELKWFFFALLLFAGWMRWQGFGAVFKPMYRELLMPMVFEAFILGACLTALQFREASNRVISRLGWVLMTLLAASAAIIHSPYVGEWRFLVSECRYQSLLLVSVWIIMRSTELTKPWWFDWFLLNAVVQYLGRISYGFYLIHFPVVHLLEESLKAHWMVLLMLSLAISLGLAVVSYEFMERPLQRWANRKDPLRPAGSSRL